MYFMRRVSGGTKFFNLERLISLDLVTSKLYCFLLSLFLLFVYYFLSQLCEAFRELRAPPHPPSLPMASLPRWKGSNLF